MTNRNPREEAFHQMLLQARTAQGYTQEQVAEAVSITPRWYQVLEKEGRLPGTLILVRLQLFLHLDLEPLRDLIGLREPGPACPKKKRKKSDKKAPPTS